LITTILSVRYKISFELALPSVPKCVKIKNI